MTTFTTETEENFNGVVLTFEDGEKAYLEYVDSDNWDAEDGDQQLVFDVDMSNVSDDKMDEIESFIASENRF